MKANKFVSIIALGMMFIAVAGIILIVGLLAWTTLAVSQQADAVITPTLAEQAATGAASVVIDITPTMTLTLTAGQGEQVSPTVSRQPPATTAAPTVAPTVTSAPTAALPPTQPAALAATSTFLPAPSPTVTVALQQYSGAGDYQAYDYSVQMLDIINRTRCDNGLTPLRRNDQLGAAALAHSIDMATNNFFSHTGSDGSDVAARVTATGYTWRAVGENLAGGPNDPARVHEMLMNSPGHRANLLDPDFREFGLGVINREAAEYRWYWTEVFGSTGSDPLSCADIGL